MILERKDGQSIGIGDGVYVKILESHRGRVRIGVVAPREVTILRIPEHREAPAGLLDPEGR